MYCIYVPAMDYNLLTIRQLAKKGFAVIIEGDSLKLFDSKKQLMLKSTLSKNRTYKCNISSDNMMCMTTTVSEDVEEVWHKRYLVHGLPKFSVKNSL
jgi:hypothetical protein